MTDAATGEGLLRAILLEPGDDDVRLVFADWLEENGEEDHASFIRVQCSIAILAEKSGHPKTTPLAWSCKCEVCEEAKPLRRRERELLEVAMSNPDWIGFDTAHVDDWTFRRGLVAEVRLPLASWVGGQCPTCRGRRSVRMPIVTRCGTCRGSGVVNRCGPSIVRAAPVERVVLSDREPLASPSGRQWFWYQHTGGASGGSSLPPALFDLLPGEPLPSTYFLCKSYPTRQAAEGALSAALIALAKAH